MKLFISRTLSEDSPFLSLQDQDIEIVGKSLLDFQYLDFIIDEVYDAVFFYSRRAIQHFFSIEVYSPTKSYGVIGHKSAKVFRQVTGADPDIIGNGDMKELGSEIVMHWREKKLLIPQASRSLNSLVPHIDQTISYTTKVIYTNSVKTNVTIPECDIYIFTSPMNFEAAHSFFDLTEKKIFAIGETTASRILELLDIQVTFPEEPSEEGLYQLIKSELGLS